MKFVKKHINCIFGAILFIIPFVNFNYGINLDDIGYNLANYENAPGINQTWLISTILSIFTGKGLTFLPFGHRMAGMVFYCSLLFGIVSVLFYRYMSRTFSPVIAFVGELTAVLMCWCPKTILYHYLGYFLFSFATVLLVEGLVRERKLFLVLSGAVLALNVFVRFPNITELALAAVFIWFFILEKKFDLKPVLYFAGSYVVIFMVGFFTIELCFGKGSYINMIASLFSMTDTATAYTPASMVLSIFTGYLEKAKYFVVLAIPACVFFLLEKLNLKKGWRYTFYGLDVLISFGLLRVYKYLGLFGFFYADYACFYLFAVIFLMIGIIACLYAAFNPGYDKRVRLYALAAIIIIFITPLGSNNGLYTIINNQFITAPLTLYIIFNPVLEKKKVNSLQISAFIIVGCLLFQGTFFTYYFRFHEQMMGKDFVEVTQVPKLKGMYTIPDKVKQLEGLYDFLEENNLTGTQTVMYGNIPFVSYAMELPNAISHIWPSLASYPTYEFEGELLELSNPPLVIYSAQYCHDLLSDTVTDFTDKEQLLHDYMSSNNYVLIYSNDYFRVCSPK